MLGYLSADIICSEKRTVFRERISRKTVSFEEQIMSKDKYPSIFSQPNWGYCVYYPSVLKIGEYLRIFPSFSWGIFAHVTRLDQSRASENIWWIINIYIGRERERERVIRGRAEIWNFKISRVKAANECDIELNTRREIPYLQATMYYCVYYISILLTKKSRLNSDPFSCAVVDGQKGLTSLLWKGTKSKGKIQGWKRFRQSNQGSSES